jgi:hypothetical protein
MGQVELSQKAQADAAKLAAATGVSVPEAIEAAVRERLLRVADYKQDKPSIEELMALIHGGSDHRPDYSLSDDEVVGYNEFGTFD